MEQTERTVAVWGDSLARGVIWNEQRKRHTVSLRTAADVVGEQLGVHVINRARFGFTAPRGLAMLTKDLETGFSCESAMIEFGGNDCNFDWAAISENPEVRHDPATMPEAFADALSRMVDRLKGVRIRPLLMTLPPIDAERYFRYLVGDRLNPANILKWLGDVQQIYRFQEMYSSLIEQVARVKDCTLLHVRRECLRNHRMSGFLCADGLHLNEAGQCFVGETIAELIRREHAGQ